MKKVIAILAVMIVIVGAVFATTGDTVKLKSKVSPIIPQFKIYSQNTTTVGPIVDADALATNKDISEDEIDWFFTVKQNGSIKKPDTDSATVVDYSRFQGTVTLTVTVAPFKSDLGTQDTSKVSIVTGEGKTAAGAGVGTGENARLSIANPTIGTADVTGYPKASFVLTYNGKKVTDEEAGVVATVYANWKPQADLPMATTGTWYIADITLGYTAQ